MKVRGGTTIRLATAVLVSGAIAQSLQLSSCPVDAAPSLSDAERLELPDRFAPVLQYVKDESCYPVQIEYYLESRSLYQVAVNSAVLVMDAPSIPELAQLTTDDYYLNNRLGGVDEDNIVRAYEENRIQLGHTVYFQESSDSPTWRYSTSRMGAGAERRTFLPLQDSS